MLVTTIFSFSTMLSRGNQHFLTFQQIFQQYQEKFPIPEYHLNCYLQKLSVWKNLNFHCEKDLKSHKYVEYKDSRVNLYLVPQIFICRIQHQQSNGFHLTKQSSNMQCCFPILKKKVPINVKNLEAHRDFVTQLARIMSLYAKKKKVMLSKISKFFERI